MKNFLQYEIEERDGQKQEIIIATLNGFGFEGFEEAENIIKATVSEGLIDEFAVDNWLKNNGFRVVKTIIPDQNWNALWESNFEPVVVDDFAGIRAHFHEPNTKVVFDIVITPKMSFGTGHHATTRQMISLMRNLPLVGKRVIDFGTGTGVLAILAEKMGAKEVEAIDNDEWSITNAAENLVNNNCNRIFLHAADSLKGIEAADILLANINKHIILQHLQALQMGVKSGGYLVLSGLLMADEGDIDREVCRLGFEKIFNSDHSGWIALVYRQTNANVN